MGMNSISLYLEIFIFFYIIVLLMVLLLLYWMTIKYLSLCFTTLLIFTHSLRFVQEISSFWSLLLLLWVNRMSRTVQEFRCVFWWEGEGEGNRKNWIKRTIFFYMFHIWLNIFERVFSDSGKEHLQSNWVMLLFFSFVLYTHIEFSAFFEFKWGKNGVIHIDCLIFILFYYYYNFFIRFGGRLQQNNT